MKSTIHTIKDKVKERLPFSISDEHYYQILEGYFSYIRDQIEGFNHIEVDNPLGTFIMREVELKSKSTIDSSYFTNRKPGSRNAVISKIVSLLGVKREDYQNCTDEELRELHDKAQERIAKKLEELQYIYKNKKLTKTDDGEDNFE
jgi:hypothetical protein